MPGRCRNPPLPACSRTSNVSLYAQQVAVGQGFQAKKCYLIRGRSLDLTMTSNVAEKILLPSARHLEERLTVSQSVSQSVRHSVGQAGRQTGRQKHTVWLFAAADYKQWETLQE